MGPSFALRIIFARTGAFTLTVLPEIASLPSNCMGIRCLPPGLHLCCSQNPKRQGTACRTGASMNKSRAMLRRSSDMATVVLKVGKRR